MKALASKSSDKSAVKSASYKQAVPTPQANVFSTTQNNGFVIQRKPACPCGGGCPRCKAESFIQPKLKIGEPNDKYEQEADRVSEQIIRMPESAVQRQVEQEEEANELLQAKPLAGQITPVIQRQLEEEEEEEEELLQAKSATGQTPEVTPALANRIIALRGGGQPLDPATRAFIEPRFGHDFSQVRLHSDTRAAQLTRSVRARAFTVGRDIVFGAGQYAPEATSGRRLLVHELVHVLQQNKIDIHHVAQQADANSRASEYNRTAAHPTQRYSAVEMIQRTPSIASWDFHNSDRIAVDNCCGACRSGVRLGVDTNFYQSRTVTNGMELKAFISNHLPGATYDIKRVKESNVWERTGTGAWASLAHQGPGADDDPSDYDECLTPRVTPAPPSNTHHIYSLDQPGLLPYYPSSNTIVSASATEAVKKASFTEWVAITDTDGAGASDPNSYDWHMILWLTKESGGTWSVDTTRSEIEPGSVTVGTNGP